MISNQKVTDITQTTLPNPENKTYFGEYYLYENALYKVEEDKETHYVSKAIWCDRIIAGFFICIMLPFYFALNTINQNEGNGEITTGHADNVEFTLPTITLNVTAAEDVKYTAVFADNYKVAVEDPTKAPEKSDVINIVNATLGTSLATDAVKHISKD